QTPAGPVSTPEMEGPGPLRHGADLPYGEQLGVDVDHPTGQVGQDLPTQLVETHDSGDVRYAGGDVAEEGVDGRGPGPAREPPATPSPHRPPEVAREPLLAVTCHRPTPKPARTASRIGSAWPTRLARIARSHSGSNFFQPAAYATCRSRSRAVS